MSFQSNNAQRCVSVCYLTDIWSQSLWRCVICQLCILILLGNRTLGNVPKRKIHSQCSLMDRCDRYHVLSEVPATAVVAFPWDSLVMRAKESPQDRGPLEFAWFPRVPLPQSSHGILVSFHTYDNLLAVTFPRPGWISSSHNWAL